MYPDGSSSAKTNEGNVGALRLRALHIQLYEHTAVKVALQKIVALQQERAPCSNVLP